MALTRKIQVTCRDTNGDTFTAFNGNWGQTYQNANLQTNARTFLTNIISPIVDGDIISARVTTAEVFYPSVTPDPEP